MEDLQTLFFGRKENGKKTERKEETA